MLLSGNVIREYHSGGSPYYSSITFKEATLALDAYDKAKTADNKKKYEWSTHVYKHVFAGTVYDKGHIIEENLVTRFSDLHEKNFYTAVDKNFVNPNIVAPYLSTSLSLKSLSESIIILSPSNFTNILR